MEVRCHELQVWRSGSDRLQAWRSGVMGCKYGGQEWWVASMEVRYDELQAWRSGVMGCKHGGQV